MSRTDLPPLSLPDRQLHAVGVQRQVQRRHGQVLRPVADAHVTVVTISEQRPRGLSDGGPRPGVAIDQRLDGHQVVEQILGGFRGGEQDGQAAAMKDDCGHIRQERETRVGTPKKGTATQRGKLTL